MTTVKYIGIYHDPHQERVVFQRGKGDRQFGYVCKCEDCTHGRSPIQDMHRVRVFELPEPMSPAEYEEYINDIPEPLVSVLDEVGEEYGYVGDRR